MKTDDEIIETIIDEQDSHIAQIIYENVFARDARYCDWKSVAYKAPEQPDGFAMEVCYMVAKEIREASPQTSNG